MMRQLIFSGWNLMRWLRLAIGAYFLVTGILQRDALVGMIGGFFLLQAVFNAGCCGSGGCRVSPSPRKIQDADPTEVSYEEIKSNGNG